MFKHNDNCLIWMNEEEFYNENNNIRDINEKQFSRKYLNYNTYKDVDKAIKELYQQFNSTRLIELPHAN